MQEEIENKTVNVAITMTKLTARGIVWGMQKAVVYLGKRHASKRASGPH